MTEKQWRELAAAIAQLSLAERRPLEAEVEALRADLERRRAQLLEGTRELVERMERRIAAEPAGPARGMLIEQLERLEQAQAATEADGRALS
jgi:hypothetical protein